MQLSRESIQRMIGSGKGLTVGIGGSSSGGSGGGVSIPYYNQNFELLYKKVVTDGTTGTVTTQYLTAAPNEIVNVGSETDPATGDVTVTTLIGPKVKSALVIGDAMLVWDAQNSAVYVINRDGTTAANFYATGGVSALGYSAGGGGGGGVSALTDLLDVQISSPSNGQALVYDTSLSPARWVNKTIFESMTYGSNVLSLTISGVTRNVTIQAGTSSVDWDNITNKPNTATRWPTFAEVTSKPTTLGDYGITDAYIINGTIYLGSNSITPVTSLYGYATQDWVSQQGYLTSSAISDMATQTWVQQQGYLTSSAISDMATKTWVNDWFVKDAGGNLGSADKIYSIGCKRVFSGYDMPDAPVDNAWVSGIALGSNWNDNHYQHYLVESGDRWYTTREYSSGSMSGWNTFAYLTDNVASATKLQTARNLWGNSFDGTADIGTQNSNASLNYVADINMSGNLTCQNVFANENVRLLESGNCWWILGYQAGSSNNSFNIVRYDIGQSSITVPLSINKTDSSITMAGNIQESGNFLLMNYSSYGLMVEGYAIFGTIRRASFGLHTASSITWSQLSGTDDIIMQLITDTNRTFAKKYAQFYDGIKIGDGMIVWDSSNNAFQVIKSDGTAANLYTTGGVSALGMSAGVSSIDAMTFGNLTVNNNLKITKGDYSHNIYGDANGSLHLDGSEYVVMGNDVLTEGYSIYCGDGSVTAKRFYIGSNRYLYLDNSNVLRYYDNGTSKIIAFS